MLISDIITYLNQNPLTVFNTLLLVLTGYLSYSSYVFQVQTSIRESLEQLEDVELRRGKVRPILHDFNHSIISDSRTSVLLKYYHDGRNPANANQPRGPFRCVRYHLANHHDKMQAGEPVEEEKFLDGLEQSLPDIPGVITVTTNDSGIFLEIDSDDAVFVRRLTEDVMEKVYNSLVLQSPEEIIEELKLEEHI